VTLGPVDPARVLAIDRAFRAGDLAALRAAVEDPASVPNGPMPIAIGPCLEYAIYHSPIAFIRQLLEAGADARPEDHTGFPPLIAAIGTLRDAPGATPRSDAIDVMRLLLEFGADPHQRGVNDYTALHMAVAESSAAAVDLLLEAGADPRLPTRIDECETPREMAERAGATILAERLAAAEARQP